MGVPMFLLRAVAVWLVINAVPARTMIGSGRSTQPPSPTLAVASRPSRSPLLGSIL